MGVNDRVRNELKHNDGGKNGRFVAGFVFEAEGMLLRAIKNYFNAFGCMPRYRRVRAWFENMTL